MQTKREKAARQRFENAKKAITILTEFMELKFRNLFAIQAIAQHYYPELTVSEIKNFWHFRNVSDDMIRKMQNVVEQLKAE